MASDAKTSTVTKANEDDARFYWLDEGRKPGGFIREIDHSHYAQGTHPLFNGIKIVDCDTHFTEPPDLYQRNAPASMKDKLPRVVRVNGADRWFIGDRDFGSLGGNVIRKDRNKLLGRLAFTTLPVLLRASSLYSVVRFGRTSKQRDSDGFRSSTCGSMLTDSAFSTP